MIIWLLNADFSTKIANFMVILIWDKEYFLFLSFEKRIGFAEKN